VENNLHYQDIYLRALEPEDLDFLYQIENDSSIWQYGANKAPVSRFCLKQ
jgi:diamine N-acetyltransferase